jgi:hypothetical protein
VKRVRRLLGFAGIAFVAAAIWHSADRGMSRGEALRAGVLDLDARIALRARIACEPSVARSEAIAAGSAPRLDAEARFVWFEAPGPDGRRQIHRIERATRRLVCLTCGEAGNNRRPAPHPTARAVLFDTDRFASWWRPLDRELMVLAAGEGRAGSSRRLTWDAARDTHALYDPSGLGVAWSRRTLAGRAVRAPIKLGHGSLSLGRREVLARGGFAGVTPLAWSPDARAFAYAGGFAFAPWAELGDFAGEAPRALPAASAYAASVSFSADGSQLARAERANGISRVWLGDTNGEPAEVELGELAAWGEPTGLALAPRADAFALAQRRGAAERIVWAELACARGAVASE